MFPKAHASFSHMTQQPRSTRSLGPRFCRDNGVVIAFDVQVPKASDIGLLGLQVSGVSFRHGLKACSVGGSEPNGWFNLSGSLGLYFCHNPRGTESLNPRPYQAQPTQIR